MTTSGMRHIPGGTFTMGSEKYYPEEAPRRRVRVDPFWLDETPVTNREFAKFVADTGYQTFAETPPDPQDYPGLLPHLAKAGSLVFFPTSGPVDLRDFSQWWAFTLGADWRHPTGPGSTLAGLEDHPVVHVVHADALAYATWAGKSLPTEAEWEFAARGGLEGCEFAWGDALAPDDRMLANFWQGNFPYENHATDGWERTSPVRSYEPNGYGLYDMIGNVWEWTDDWYVQPAGKRPGSCCVAENPRGGSEYASMDPGSPDLRIGRKVIKGGSHLCAPNYCQRYRPAARHPQPLDTSTSHVGFRCVVRAVQAPGRRP
ncbi:MAG: hypothetical protein RL026_558 [Pseudomonadota bacterium]|jgi:formylglycine-generating enzyme required for sulfatase activity